MRALCLLVASFLAPLAASSPARTHPRLQAAPVDTSSAPRIEADRYATEFGTIFRGELLNTKFTIYNHGQSDLTIQKITNSCQCTASSFTIDGKTWIEAELRDATQLGVLSPGEEALLEVKMRTAIATTPGKDAAISKAIRIYSNDPNRRVMNLELNATMISPFTIEPTTIDFGVVHKGTRAKRSAVIWSDTLGDFPITGATSPSPEFVTVTATRVATDPGVPPTWRIDAELAPTTPIGDVISHVDLVLDHARVKEIQLQVHYAVESNVVFIDNKPDHGELLDFEVMTAGTAKTIELTVENGDASVPYLLRSAALSNCRPTSTGFVCEVIEVERGMKYVVKVTAPGTLGKTSYFQGDLVLTADHPDVPLRKVRYRGWYKQGSP